MPYCMKMQWPALFGMVGLFSCGNSTSSPSVLEKDARVQEDAHADAPDQPDVSPDVLLADASNSSDAGMCTVDCPQEPCVEDNLQTGALTGFQDIGLSSGLATLCKGEVLVGNQETNEIVQLDALTGAVVQTYSTTAAPSALAHDAEDDLLYAALDIPVIVRIDLGSGTQSALALPAPAFDLTVGNQGLVFVSLDTTPFNSVAIVNGVAGTVVATVSGSSSEFGELAAYDKDGDQLITADQGLSPSSLMRHAFNPATLTLTMVQSRWNAGGNGQDLAVSPDGNHIAFSCGGGNGSAPYTIWDFSANDLEAVYGEWDTGPYPRSAAFSPDGAHLAATNGDEIMVFDTATYELIQSSAVSTSGCSYAELSIVAFSQGSHLVYAYTDCDFNNESGRLYWVRFDP